jgi:hypothetical protein
MSAASQGASSLLRRAARKSLLLIEYPFVRVARARAIRRSGKRNIDAARKWRRKRWSVSLLEGLSYLGTAALAVGLVWSVVVLIHGPWVLNSINRRCGKDSAACGTVVGFLVPLLSVAVASAVFLFYRLRYVRSPILKRAKASPQDLVETATPDIGAIVGRDELCHVIMEDIRQQDIRRPHLVVGGVGAGKTAVLVRLTKLLADRGAIPVPIRLRDAKDSLDFRELAYGRFRVMSERRVLSTGEAEKIWRQLSNDDKIVVLADGLEEALTEGNANRDRDNLIRLAIHRARELGLPLVIASRPHDPLRGADATIMELEPLSEEAALEYIDPDETSTDARRLDWIVETAGLTELPLYLQITRQLSQHERLDYISADRSAKVDTRSLDRSKLRLHLLDTWMEALFDGHLRPTVPLDRKEREAAVVWLSALACIGLAADTIDVKFEEYYRPKPADKPDVRQPPIYKDIDKAVQGCISEKLPRRHLDIRLAVTWGDQLGLVEAHGDGLRFPHSIMQAYLGSRFMRTALADEEFRKVANTALQKPGRELLIALVLYSRSPKASQKTPARRAIEAPRVDAAIEAPRVEPGLVGDGIPQAPEAQEEAQKAAETAQTAGTAQKTGPLKSADRADVTEAPEVTGPAAPVSDGPSRTRAGADGKVDRKPEVPVIGGDVKSIRDVLERSAARDMDDVKKLDLYAAAMEIDSFLVHNSHHQAIAKRVARQWLYIRGGDQRTLDEAKLGLVHRFADAARTVAARAAAARAADSRTAAGRTAASRTGETRKNQPKSGAVPTDPAYRELLGIGCREASYSIRLAIAQEIGAGGDEAFRVLHESTDHARYDPWEKVAWPDAGANARRSRRPPRQDQDGARHRPEHNGRPSNENKDLALRARTLCAWITPLLVGSVDKHAAAARAELQRWLAQVGHEGAGRADSFPVSLEVALAQGFKYAANRRRLHPHALPETRFYLQEQAIGMLKRARFWFSELTLIQALCLWEMRDPDAGRDASARDGPSDRSGTRDHTHRRGSNPEAIVARWLELCHNKEHPFVKEVGKLAVRALKTRRPQRFLWIDESGIVASVGSRTVQATSYRKHHLWIPPSAGWAALNPRAQQLVADVLLILNLAERGEQSDEIRRVDGCDLPPCLTQDRDPLEPRNTVGGLYTAPGSNCMDNCRFGLCPYPPKGLQPYRSELNEAFCRSQQTLLSGWLTGLTAPWQTMPRRHLKRFWADMADRARDESGSRDRT